MTILFLMQGNNAVDNETKNPDCNEIKNSDCNASTKNPDCNASTTGEKLIDVELVTGEFDGVKPVKMHISVNKGNYGNYLHWTVKCDKPTGHGAFIVHPFRLVMEDVTNDEIGEVIADNEMIRKMLEHLSMTDEELIKHIGTSSVIEHRGRIIKALTLFWD